MKAKHVMVRIEQCIALSKASNCPRRKFGALLIDPERNVILMDGYNGGPRGGGRLCGGEECLRDKMEIESGTRNDIGCHHAEMNVICNAAANGVRCQGAWLIATGEPCILCAKLIHHAGITKVLVVAGGYVGANGVNYLMMHNIVVECVAGPPDPRSLFQQEIRKPPSSMVHKSPGEVAADQLADDARVARLGPPGKVELLWVKNIIEDEDCPTCEAQRGRECDGLPTSLFHTERIEVARKEIDSHPGGAEWLNRA